MSTAAWTVPALLLTAVLVISAAAKLGAPIATADAFVSLRLPRWLGTIHAPQLLAPTELALALGLVLAPAPLALPVALAVLVLMLSYLVVVARATRFAEPVECSCFGRIGTGPIGPVTVVRNLLLVGTAGLAVADAASGHSLRARLADLSEADALWLLMLALAAAVVATIGFPTGGSGPADREPFGADAEDLDYLRVPIPYAALRTAEGETVTLRSLAATGARLLVFVNPGCGPCLRVLDGLPTFIAATPALTTHVVLGAGDVLPAETAASGVSVLVDEGRLVQSLFGVATPAAVLLGADGLLAGGPVSGYPATIDLMAQIATQLAEPVSDDR